MLLKPIAILVLIGLFSANCSNLLVYTSFNINKKYISNSLCENRYNTELKCFGKCYLMKKLKQAKEKEQKQEQQNQKLEVQFAMHPSAFNFATYAFAKIIRFIPFSTGSPITSYTTIFHPPN